ncbi:hypothetical protein VTJ04DRAFT_625 [Mycothermus thermophilus]|uniref:uncharacterized protein n=1 Tax=Humicola insolens TaxID=85995 RepID=UPI003742BD29
MSPFPPRPDMVQIKWLELQEPHGGQGIQTQEGSCRAVGPDGLAWCSYRTISRASKQATHWSGVVLEIGRVSVPAPGAKQWWMKEKNQLTRGKNTSNWVANSGGNGPVEGNGVYGKQRWIVEMSITAMIPHTDVSFYWVPWRGHFQRT